MEVANSIIANGYELCTVSQFLAKASDEHIARYNRDCAEKGSFIVWDPIDDANGFMIVADTVEELNKEFLKHFGCFLFGGAK